MSISLQESKVGWSSENQYRRSSRRNRPEDLEKEVEMIMSQEDDSDIEMDIAKENKIPVTPKSNKHAEKHFESSSAVKNNTLPNTPRRSSRKSIKPVQEYEDIVSYKRQLRSTSKVGEEIDKEKKEEGSSNMEEQQPRWTPAKVGRVSQKRGRKSRKTVGDKNKSKLKSSSDSEDTTDVNKECLQSNEVIKPIEENINDSSNIKKLASNVEISKVTNMVNMEEKAKEVTNKEENFNITNTEDITKEKEHEKEVIKKEAKVEDSALVQELKEKIIINVEDNSIENTKQQENKNENVTKEDSIGHEELEEGIEEVKEEKGEDKFGTYLKNNLDISDLGLNPLTEENAVNDNLQQMKESNCNIAETEENVKPDIQVVTINDDTFNSSDCIMINAEQADVEDEMQPLQLSDDESSMSSPHKTPCIILTTDKGVDQKLNVTASQTVGSTPKRYLQTAKRMPTPYKKNTDISIMEDGMDQKWADEPPITIELSKMEPKEIVLRSIRKRSFSVCIGGAEADTKRKNVTFYSPANQTAILEDLDVRMVQSVKKKNVDLKSANTETFITQRRKRSLSFDEAMINKSKYRTQTPSKMGVTPQKIKPIRTKLPNFAAIHLKNFEKMENLVDHVNRKAERAKILTNSASKERVASAQKPVKPHQPSATTTNPDKSKAKAKRINLHASVNSTFAGVNTTFDTSRKDLHDSKLPLPRIGVCKPLVTSEASHKENREVKLPNPRLGNIKPHIITFASNKNKQMTPAKNALKPTQTRQAVRPAFNLSTAPESHADNAKSAKTTGAVTKANAQRTNTTASTMSVDEKMASRRQRHMDMFKGRAANTRTTPGTAEKAYGQLIRGVRSNRRFELQMAHRKNMEH